MYMYTAKVGGLAFDSQWGYPSIFYADLPPVALPVISIDM